MTQGFQKFTKRYVNVLGVLIGVAVVSSILLYSGCGMTSRPNVPTPTPTPAPTPTPDTTPPTSTITSPTAGATVLAGVAITITGTASDTGGGSVVRVEVSVDGGATFSAATGTNAWSFNWTPSAPGQATIKSRAVDNAGNVQNPPAEIHVTKGPTTFRVPSDRPTIQSAINDAIDGDRVLVAPGTYPEHIDFKGKAITVTSESGPQDTIIDGGNTDSVVRFTSGEGRDSALNGFTIQNGRSTVFGDEGGIRIQASSPTIRNNVIRNNQADSGTGGGISIIDGSPLIQLNTITSNIAGSHASGSGGGISVLGASSVEILDNVISNNVAAGTALEPSDGAGGGIFLSASGTSIVKRNIIKGNAVSRQAAGGSGGGIFIANHSDALIAENLITGNRAANGAGLSLGFGAGASGTRLVNN